MRIDKPITRNARRVQRNASSHDQRVIDQQLAQPVNSGSPAGASLPSCPVGLAR